jgi:hypothetical protein
MEMNLALTMITTGGQLRTTQCQQETSVTQLFHGNPENKNAKILS